MMLDMDSYNLGLQLPMYRSSLLDIVKGGSCKDVWYSGQLSMHCTELHCTELHEPALQCQGLF